MPTSRVTRIWHTKPMPRQIKKSSETEEKFGRREVSARTTRQRGRRNCVCVGNEKNKEQKKMSSGASTWEGSHSRWHEHFFCISLFHLCRFARCCCCQMYVFSPPLDSVVGNLIEINLWMDETWDDGGGGDNVLDAKTNKRFRRWRERWQANSVQGDKVKGRGELECLQHLRVTVTVAVFCAMRGTSLCRWLSSAVINCETFAGRVYNTNWWQCNDFVMPVHLSQPTFFHPRSHSSSRARNARRSLAKTLLFLFRFLFGAARVSLTFFFSVTLFFSVGSSFYSLHCGCLFNDFETFISVSFIFSWRPLPLLPPSVLGMIVWTRRTYRKLRAQTFYVLPRGRGSFFCCCCLWHQYYSPAQKRENTAASERFPSFEPALLRKRITHILLYPHLILSIILLIFFCRFTPPPTFAVRREWCDRMIRLGR